MTTLRSGCRGCDEQGAALVMVLAFLSLFGLAIAALLGFSQTSFKTTMVVRSLSGAKYAADGAVESAIHAWRDQAAVGASAGPCGSFAPAVVNDTATRVECTAFAPTAGSSGVQVTSANKPKTALLTLGTDAGEDGLYQGSNSGLRIKGQVYSNSSVTNTASAAHLTVDGPLVARGSCNGRITSTPAKSCHDTTANQAGADPNYEPATNLVPQYRTVPACSPNSVVTFLPGYYDDAAALSNMMRSGAGAPCPGSVFWFRPDPAGGVGVFYFDFRGPSTARTWTVDDSNARVIGGTPKGWSPTAVPAPAVTVPGACSTPLDGLQDGVQFMFGNDSRMDVRAGHFEICAQPSSTSVPVAVYGLKSGQETTTSATLVEATAASSPAGHFASPANAIAKDGSLATADLVDGGTASIELTGFNLPAAIPAGSVVTDAKLRVAHRDERVGNGSASTIEKLSATLKVNRAGAPPIPAVGVTVANDGPGSAVHEEPYAVPLTALASEARQHGLTGFSLTYSGTAKNNKSAVESLDSVRLDITYTPPALQAQTRAGSCVGTAPYNPGATNCAMVTTNGAQTKFYVQGTFYAPRAALDLNLTNVTEHVFKWGLVVRSLRLSITPSASFSEPTIQIPDDTSSAARALILTAYVCPGQSSCPSGGTARVRAKVTFDDGTGLPPKVESWSVLA